MWYYFTGTCELVDILRDGKLASDDERLIRGVVIKLIAEGMDPKEAEKGVRQHITRMHERDSELETGGQAYVFLSRLPEKGMCCHHSVMRTFDVDMEPSYDGLLIVPRLSIDHLTTIAAEDVKKLDYVKYFCSGKCSSIPVEVL
ncbi:MAG: hypothetical protein ACE5DM_05440 [Candidatus Nanoarchaeia archaeon]